MCAILPTLRAIDALLRIILPQERHHADATREYIRCWSLKVRCLLALRSIGEAEELLRAPPKRRPQLGRAAHQERSQHPGQDAHHLARSAHAPPQPGCPSLQGRNLAAQRPLVFLKPPHKLHPAGPLACLQLQDRQHLRRRLMHHTPAHPKKCAGKLPIRTEYDLMHRYHQEVERR